MFGFDAYGTHVPGKKRAVRLDGKKFDCPLRDFAYDYAKSGRNALLVDFGNVRHWIPLSQIACHDTIAKIIVIPEWLARKKGLL